VPSINWTSLIIGLVLGFVAANILSRRRVAS
jgi:hypothetical protein